MPKRESAPSFLGHIIKQPRRILSARCSHAFAVLVHSILSPRIIREGMASGFRRRKPIGGGGRDFVRNTNGYYLSIVLLMWEVSLVALRS
jgi:hypothetical protein